MPGTRLRPPWVLVLAAPVALVALMVFLLLSGKKEEEAAGPGSTETNQPTRRGVARVPAWAPIPAPAADPAAAPPAPPAAPAEVSPACAACEKKQIASGACEPDSGCDALVGEDRRLCDDLLACMRATNCWIKDPLDCLCGTVDYVACTQGGNGACRAEMQAATRTTDPVKNGTLFYDPSVPAGRANRLISCDRDKCRSACSLAAEP